MRLLRSFHSLLGHTAVVTCRRLHQQSAQQLPLLANALPTFADIERLVQSRKTNADLPLIQATLERLQQQSVSTTDDHEILHRTLAEQLRLLPNDTHPAARALSDSDEPHLLGHFGGEHTAQLADGSAARPFADICRRLNILRTEHLGHFTGPKSYYLLQELADLEQALVQFTVAELRRRSFRLVSVPDILPAGVIEGCGMRTTGARNQVYKVDTGLATEGVQCLSGTAEMALAGYFAGKRLAVGRGRTPLRVMAASRCFRAETSGLQEEKGIYRVHTFSKVEMFAVCGGSGGNGDGDANAESDAMLEEFRSIEMELFERLRLPFRLLDMPPGELGAPAYRKYDIEAWLPGRAGYGEISSCSNCTDYQARRLGIRVEGGGTDEFVHTVNGTACAVPRMLMAIVENYQVSYIYSPVISQQKCIYIENGRLVRKIKHFGGRLNYPKLYLNDCNCLNHLPSLFFVVAIDK